MFNFSLKSDLIHNWNAFQNDGKRYQSLGYGYYRRPDRIRLSINNERSIIASIYNRISIDVASMNISHVKVDENGRYSENIQSGLNECLNVSANLDQTGRAFLQDVTMSLLDEGCVAIVPTDTTMDPLKTGSYDINSLRVGEIKEWYPKHIMVKVYNENIGDYSMLTLNKKHVAIIENPLYAVMNEPNSTLKRLARKLNLLDISDERVTSSKLDVIIQTPYGVRSSTMMKKAEERRQNLENQLVHSPYGIGYIDGTERITQLNRPVENNLMKQVEYLTSMLYSQLGLSDSIINGTADEKTILNYQNRTIEPIISAIVDEMIRKFLTKTARTQKQTIIYFSQPFKLVPVTEISEMADKFTRNEILTSNEVRSIIGFKPSSDPNADELRNKNLKQTIKEEIKKEEPEREVDKENEI